MPIGNLLKSQSNEIYLALVDAKCNLAEFEWDEVHSPTYGASLNSPKLAHKPSGYYFIFDNHSSTFHYKYAPASITPNEKGKANDWSHQVKLFKLWLDYLLREVNAPDLWAELPTDSKLIESASDEDDNSKFTKEEKKQILTGLEEIKKYLLEAHKLDPELVEGQLKYLIESADRLGRKDWKNALVSVIFGIIIQGGIAGHTAQEIFQYVWTILSAVLVQKLYLP